MTDIESLSTEGRSREGLRPVDRDRSLADAMAQGDGAVEVIPGNGYRFSRALAMLSDPHGAKAEAIGALRTHLLAQHLRDRRRSLAICAPSSGVGCTYLTVNLAVALAMAGVRTLVIDANMRRPGLDALIQPTNPRQGLRQYLAQDGLPLGEAICDDVLPNLSLLYSGGVAGNTQELLAGTAFKSLVAICMRDFDLVLIDTPASNSCADARLVAGVARYAMVVVRRNDSFVSDVKQLVHELETDRASVIGTFLNDF